MGVKDGGGWRTRGRCWQRWVASLGGAGTGQGREAARPGGGLLRTGRLSHSGTHTAAQRLLHDEGAYALPVAGAWPQVHSPCGGPSSADVCLVVGGRPFRAHRLILAARCDYFKRLFAGGFADSGAQVRAGCMGAWGLERGVGRVWRTVMHTFELVPWVGQDRVWWHRRLVRRRAWERTRVPAGDGILSQNELCTANGTAANR